MDADRAAEHRKSDLAARLNELFATVTNRSRGEPAEYTTPAVAQAISDDPAHDTTISRVYLNGLRNGTNTNPTIGVVRAIAKFFDEHRGPVQHPVTTAYLLGEEDAEQRALRTALSDERVRSLALRAGELDDARLDQALRMLTVLAREAAGERERGEVR